MLEKQKDREFSILSRSEKDTYRIAASVATFLQTADVLILSGDLACGKTYFVKGLALALKSKDTVTSPTYALVHTYTTCTYDLMHIDAYRLSSVREFQDLGLNEYMDDSIVAIEWGDKVASDFDDYLSISFHLEDSNPNHRILVFHSVGQRWDSQMKTIMQKTRM